MTGSTGDLIGNRIADKITKSPKLHHRRFQKQLQMKPKRLSIKKKNLKKDTYIQKKDRMMIWDEYNGLIMEYQKVINLIGNTPNQPCKFRTKNWVEINDDSRGTYSTNSQIKVKTSMLKSNLCDYNDTYILVKLTISLANTEAAAAGANKIDKKVISKNDPPFTDRISEINNGQC